jgi:hypothetical protein
LLKPSRTMLQGFSMGIGAGASRTLFAVAALAGAIGCSSPDDEVLAGSDVSGPSSTGAGGWAAAGTSTGGPSGAGGGGLGTGEGSPQSWQKTTDELLFPSVSVGGKDKLELRRVRVSTVVEGLCARTVVDHIFYNPFPQTLEGVFSYPLPPEASVSFFGMFDGTTAADPPFFGPKDALEKASAEQIATAGPDQIVAGADASLWPNGKTARVVRSAKATNAYELESAQQIDPGLVEEVAPGSFRVRVFPLPGNAFVRLLIAYEQTLPRVGGELEYTLGLPKGPIDELSLTFTGSKQHLSALGYAGTVPGVAALEGASAHTYTAAFKGESPGGTFVFKAVAAASTSQADALAGTDAGLGHDYFQVRLHPDLSGAPIASVGNPYGVFLVDTSWSEHPDQFAVNLQILEAILVGSPELKSFRVMTFDTGARWLGGWTTNDAVGRADTMSALGAILLEGATDVGAALDRLAAETSLPAGETLDVFLLSDGVLTWGDASALSIALRFAKQAPFASRVFAYRTGLGADNLALLRELTRTGAIFNCFSKADVPGCAIAHRSAGVAIESVVLAPAAPGGALASNLLVAGRQAALFPGATLTLAGRLLQSGAAVVQIKGKSLGTPIEIAVPVTLAPAGALAPRAWAEIAVSQLAETHDPALEGLAMAIAQRYRIASRLGSFLVLESEQDYVAYDLEDETAKFQGQPIAELVAAGLGKLAGGLTSWLRLRTTLFEWKDVNKIPSLDGGNLVARPPPP